MTEDNIKPASRAGDLGPVTNESAMKCREALNNIDLCFMGTIDAFVQKLMNEHPYEFNVPAKTSVLSEDKEIEYITQEYFNILNKDPFYDENTCDLLKKASSFISKTVLIQGIKMFLNLKANETKFPTVFKTDFDLDVELADAKKHVKNILNILTDYNNFEDSDLPATPIGILKNKRLLLGSWNRDTSLIIKQLSLFTEFTITEKVVKANKMYIPEQYIVFNRGKGRFVSKPFDDALNLINTLVNGLGYLAMHKCATEIAKKFQHLGYFTYADFIVSLRDSLRKDAAGGGKIIKYIQQTRKYYMLDEFQDTNPLQVEIFFYLSAIEPKENYRDCHPMPGSLFIVGDPKQSIYRFTGADVQVFSDTQKLFDNDVNSEQLFLTRNFRSSKKLREWFNDTMPKTLKTGTDDTNYYDIPIDNVPLHENEATFHDVYLFRDKVVKSGKKSIYDCDQVCYLINTIVNNPKYTILAKDENENKVIRKIMYKDIMLIIPTKGKMENYMKSF
ncbi:MAG: UvrD-helicase domain-containing protein, partial [Bacilli bacterium]|nr:UvrD-helicase domain-containing protein [Bacilli bacterium]